MLAYTARRVLATIPIMALVALFVFSLIYLAPGDPAAIMAGDQATPAEVERIRALLGLDRPFVVRFGEWVWDAVRGGPRRSIFSDMPVSQMIGQRIGPTLSLMISTLTISIGTAVLLGVLAAWRKGQVIDRVVMLFAVLSFSMPVFVVGYLLTYVFAWQLNWLPPCRVIHRSARESGPLCAASSCPRLRSAWCTSPDRPHYSGNDARSVVAGLH